jgi:hypothetical protein
MAVIFKWAKNKVSVPVAATTDIAARDIVVFNASGYAVPGTNTADHKLVGVACQGVDNTPGSNGDKYVTCWTEGLFLMPAASIAVTNNGEQMYVTGAKEMDETGSNAVKLGKLINYVSATSGWVLIGHAL